LAPPAGVDDPDRIVHRADHAPTPNLFDQPPDTVLPHAGVLGTRDQLVRGDPPQTPATQSVRNVARCEPERKLVQQRGLADLTRTDEQDTGTSRARQDPENTLDEIVASVDSAEPPLLRTLGQIVAQLRQDPRPLLSLAGVGRALRYLELDDLEAR